ncbi:tryptophan synthase subunit alpha [Salinisphaera sp.]|uniref:tryptophan synthase subunit alpha n=1 Tax=Salinisphaera sp. TaxID=1914330 RepID=UPI002D77FBA0|nr:tryptophan synthase subunit alpha [Salinisphaera sp.]HET7314380.1 tryptophan synthase subunit alpha [Salinisphaera sp.]
MSRLADRFAELKSARRTALIPYLTAGDPAPDATADFMHALVEAGADVIELGVPFTDPMADGPVIQAACERALAHNTSLRDVLDMVERFRERDTDTPVVLMGYFNPIDSMGLEIFGKRARAAGVDGALIVDMTAEEAPDIAPALAEAGIDPVCLIAPTTGEARIARICENAAGFIYYVSFKGVTGASSLDTGGLAAQIAPIRRATRLPVGVGFGVRTPENAAAVAAVADAVVVGSALVRQIAEHGADRSAAARKLSETLAAMRAAIDRYDESKRDPNEQEGESA